MQRQSCSAEVAGADFVVLAVTVGAEVVDGAGLEPLYVCTYMAGHPRLCPSRRQKAQKLPHGLRWLLRTMLGL